jgi:DNA uptake protein ComE-like DNA-binding protein
MHRSVLFPLLSLALLAQAHASLGAQGTPDKPAQAAPSDTPAPPKVPVPPKATPAVKAKPKAAQTKAVGDWKAKAASAQPDTKAQTRAKAKSSAAWKAKAADYARRVNLNAAGKEDLKKVKGITDAIADKIIAGRPYLSKAHLVTHNIIPMSLYQTIKDQVKVETKPGTTLGPAKR